jgi:hypothetical protein
MSVEALRLYPKRLMGAVDRGRNLPVARLRWDMAGGPGEQHKENMLALECALCRFVPEPFCSAGA